MTLLTGADAVSISAMPGGLDVYCGYQAGAPGYARGGYTTMPQVEAAFPGKKYLCVGTDCIDVEPGLASASDVPGFVRSWKQVNTNKPVIYADESTMPSVTSALLAAGIQRTGYYLWVALWDGVASVPSGYDGKQFRSMRYDADVFEDYMWTPVTPPPPPLPGIPGDIRLSLNAPVYSVTVTWDAVENPEAGGVKGSYEVQVENLEGDGWKLIRQGYATAATAATVGGLEGGKTLRFRVSGGNWSPWTVLRTP